MIMLGWCAEKLLLHLEDEREAVAKLYLSFQKKMFPDIFPLIEETGGGGGRGGGERNKKNFFPNRSIELFIRNVG